MFRERINPQPFYAPFQSLSGQITDRHAILKHEFQTLKAEIEFRMYPPTPSSQYSSSGSDEETSSFTVQDEAIMSLSMQETMQNMSETSSEMSELSVSSSEEESSAESSQ